MLNYFASSTFSLPLSSTSPLWIPERNCYVDGGTALRISKRKGRESEGKWEKVEWVSGRGKWKFNVKQLRVSSSFPYGCHGESGESWKKSWMDDSRAWGQYWGSLQVKVTFISSTCSAFTIILAHANHTWSSIQLQKNCGEEQDYCCFHPAKGNIRESYGSWWYGGEIIIRKYEAGT